MKSVIDLKSWNRKEHFEFFTTFDEPFFGLVAEIDCTSALNWCRLHQVPFFHYYLFQSLRAANQVEAFRIRIEDDLPVIYDTIHVSSTIIRPDNTFGFSFVPFEENFSRFSRSVKAETEAVACISGLRLNENTSRNDVIHFSVLPWIKFTGLTHARHFANRDSVPKITCGKYYSKDERILMPVSVNAHHGLMDALHVAEFFKSFEAFLANPEY